MAGDWMKIELELSDKPEVHYIANGLKLDPDAVVGKLVRVWGWFDKHTADGNALGVTYSLIDRITGITGFGEMMCLAGWMEQRDKVLHMPKFDAHTSASAKKRAESNKRVALHRKGKRNSDVTQEVLPKALPEKRREEVIKPSEPSGSHEAIWEEGIALLKAKGLADSTARSFVGMLCKRHEVTDVADAFQSAAGKADPKGYIQAILKTKPLKGAPESRATFD